MAKWSIKLNIVSMMLNDILFFFDRDFYHKLFSLSSFPTIYENLNS